MQSVNSNHGHIINQKSQRNENILYAVLALLKEFDEGELEFIKRDIDQKLEKRNK